MSPPGKGQSHHHNVARSDLANLREGDASLLLLLLLLCVFEMERHFRSLQKVDPRKTTDNHTTKRLSTNRSEVCILKSLPVPMSGKNSGKYFILDRSKDITSVMALL